MWLAIKDLYTGVKAQVLYSGYLSRQFSVSQGTGQGRRLAPLMYKVYNNALLIALSNHAYALNINSLSLPSPTPLPLLLTIFLCLLFDRPSQESSCKCVTATA